MGTEKYFTSAGEVREEIIRLLESAGWKESIYNEGGKGEIRCYSKGDMEVACYPYMLWVTMSREGLFFTSSAAYQYIEVTGSRIRGSREVGFDLEVTAGND